MGATASPVRVMHAGGLARVPFIVWMMTDGRAALVAVVIVRAWRSPLDKRTGRVAAGSRWPRRWSSPVNARSAADPRGLAASAAETAALREAVSCERVRRLD